MSTPLKTPSLIAPKQHPQDSADNSLDIRKNRRRNKTEIPHQFVQSQKKPTFIYIKKSELNSNPLPENSTPQQTQSAKSALVHQEEVPSSNFQRKPAHARTISNTENRPKARFAVTEDAQSLTTTSQLYAPINNNTLENSTFQRNPRSNRNHSLFIPKTSSTTSSSTLNPSNTFNTNNQRNFSSKPRVNTIAITPITQTPSTIISTYNTSTIRSTKHRQTYSTAATYRQEKLLQEKRRNHSIVILNKQPSLLTAAAQWDDLDLVAKPHEIKEIKQKELLMKQAQEEQEASIRAAQSTKQQQEQHVIVSCDSKSNPINIDFQDIQKQINSSNQIQSSFEQQTNQSKILSKSQQDSLSKDNLKLIDQEINSSTIDEKNELQIELIPKGSERKQGLVIPSNKITSLQTDKILIQPSNPQSNPQIEGQIIIENDESKQLINSISQAELQDDYQNQQPSTIEDVFTIETNLDNNECEKQNPSKELGIAEHNKLVTAESDTMTLENNNENENNKSQNEQELIIEELEEEVEFASSFTDATQFTLRERVEKDRQQICLEKELNLDSDQLESAEPSLSTKTSDLDEELNSQLDFFAAESSAAEPIIENNNKNEGTPHENQLRNAQICIAKQSTICCVCHKGPQSSQDINQAKLNEINQNSLPNTAIVNCTLSTVTKYFASCIQKTQSNYKVSNEQLHQHLN